VCIQSFFILVLIEFNINNQAVIAKNFKLVRKTLRYKQVDIAKELGIRQHYLSDIERGVKNPSNVLIKLFCCRFRVNENWLLTGQGEMLDTDKKASVDIVGKIEAIDALKEKGSITDTEFHILKNKLLAPLKGT